MLHDSWLTCGCERAGRLRKRPPKSTWGHAGVQGTGGADGREQKWYRRHRERERVGHGMTSPPSDARLSSPSLAALGEVVLALRQVLKEEIGVAVDARTRDANHAECDARVRARQHALQLERQHLGAVLALEHQRTDHERHVDPAEELEHVVLPDSRDAELRGCGRGRGGGEA